MLQHLDKYNIILGSGSPRRSELLNKLGLKFSIKKSNIEEVFPDDLDPQQVPGYLSKLKADDLLQSLNSEDLLITADTIVLLENQILGKPKDPSEAKEMLLNLSNRTHEVISSFCVSFKGNQTIISDKSIVYFAPIDENEARWYIDTNQVMDKAGAYGVQDWVGLCKVRRIEGSHFNIMGLPVHRLYEVLARLD